ncbi:hypothetical protein FHS72_001259 [Loktanella ponticola]|uniref:Uncharacterized protein n=1 Tax=Yoonia ponticola TaxID=1524255 RepID=A0A7W9BJE1_9RHOB|nr:hypothetical protein [Yoonia ponticola]MBB5721647.1 hypothetical protein [Yoonia ponticola]
MNRLAGSMIDKRRQHVAMFGDAGAVATLGDAAGFLSSAVQICAKH